MDWTKSDFLTQRKQNVYFETKAEYVFFSNLRGEIKYCLLLERFWINLSPSVYARKKNTISKSSRATMFNFGSKVRFYFQRAKITIRHDSRTSIFFLVGQQVMFVVCSLFSTIFVQRSKCVEKDFHHSSCFS